jgi:sigma-E factor negative regulatory protein RseB
VVSLLLKSISLRHPNTLIIRCLVLVCALLAVSNAALAVDDVEQARNLLRKMVAANRELDYQGIFTYEHAGSLKSIRITHFIKGGLEYEKLLYLNGPRKEIVRRGVSPKCRKTEDRFLQAVPMPSEHISNIESHYELFLRGEDRVADRPVKIIHIVPKDAMRYGYILSIDSESGLLLQSLLVGTNRRVMERFQYVDLTLGVDERAVEELFAPAVEGADGDCRSQPAASKTQVWKANWLPPGFELASSYQDQDGNLSMSYTDGLSFVSVFVDSGNVTRFPDIQAQRGATVAQLAKVVYNGKDYAICVVGEVPPETASKIAQFVSP